MSTPAESEQSKEVKALPNREQFVKCIKFELQRNPINVTEWKNKLFANPAKPLCLYADLPSVKKIIKQQNLLQEGKLKVEYTIKRPAEVHQDAEVVKKITEMIKEQHNKAIVIVFPMWKKKNGVKDSTLMEIMLTPCC
jgi:hypothetical protein